MSKHSWALNKLKLAHADSVLSENTKPPLSIFLTENYCVVTL